MPSKAGLTGIVDVSSQPVRRIMLMDKRRNDVAKRRPSLSSLTTECRDLTERSKALVASARETIGDFGNQIERVQRCLAASKEVLDRAATAAALPFHRATLLMSKPDELEGGSEPSRQ